MRNADLWFLPSSRIEIEGTARSDNVRVALLTHRQTVGIGIEKRLCLTLQLAIYGMDADVRGSQM
jgi:hypothetical protein